MTRATRVDSVGADTNQVPSSLSLRYVGRSSLASVSLRCVNLAAALVTMTLATWYFGAERLAVWATVLSLEALLTFADLGLGNALVSIVAAARDEASHREARSALSSALATTSGIAAILAVLAGLAFASGMPSAILGVRSAMREDTDLAICLFLLCLSLTVPLGVFERVQTGLHLAHVAAAWRAATAVAQVAALVIAVSAEWDIAPCVLAYSVVPVAMRGLQGLMVLRRFRTLRPSLALLSSQGLRSMLRTGSQYVAAQSAMAVITASDQSILLRQAGAIEAARYAVPARALLALPALTIVGLLPAWPAYAAAAARGNVNLIRRINRVVLAAIAAIVVVLVVVVQFLGPTLLQHWTPRAPTAGRALLLGLSIWTGALMVGMAMAVLLAGLDRLLPLAVCTMAAAVVCLPLKIHFAQASGAVAVVWSNVLVFGCCVLIPSAIVVPRLLRGKPSPPGAKPHRRMEA